MVRENAASASFELPGNARLLGDELQGRQFETPTGAVCKRLHILNRVQIGNEARIGALVHMHEFGVVFDQMAATQIRAAGEYLRASYVIKQDRIAALPSHERHNNMARRAFFEYAD